MFVKFDTEPPINDPKLVSDGFDVVLRELFPRYEGGKPSVEITGSHVEINFPDLRFFHALLATAGGGITWLIQQGIGVTNWKVESYAKPGIRVDKYDSNTYR